jgi:hypothetical protein
MSFIAVYIVCALYCVYGDMSAGMGGFENNNLEKYENHYG